MKASNSKRDFIPWMQKIILVFGLLGLSFSCAAFANPPASHASGGDEFAQAYLQYSTMKYNKAAPHFDAAVKLEPNNHNWRGLRGLNSLHMHRYREAILDLTAALSGKESHTQFLQGRAFCYVQLEEWTHAKTDFETLRKKFPHEPELSLLIAQVYAHLNRKAEADQMLAEAQKYCFNPHTLQVVTLAETLVTSERFREAERMLESESRLEECNAELWLLLGRMSFEKEDFARAIQNFDRCLALCKDQDSIKAQCYIERSHTLQHLARYSEAIVDATHAYTLGQALLARDAYAPAYITAFSRLRPRALELRANAYSGIKQNDKAVNDLLLAQKLTVGGNLEINYRLAEMCFNIKRYADAIANADIVLATTPDDAPSRMVRWRSFAGLKRYDKAISDLNYLIAESGKDELLYFSRGDIYKCLGKLDQAVADYSMALKLRPEDIELPTIYRARADAYRKLGKTELAAIDEKSAKLIVAKKALDEQR